MENTLPLAAMLKLCLVWDANPVPQNLLRCRTVLKFPRAVKTFANLYSSDRFGIPLNRKKTVLIRHPTPL